MPHSKEALEHLNTTRYDDADLIREFDYQAAHIHALLAIAEAIEEGFKRLSVDLNRGKGDPR